MWVQQCGFLCGGNDFISTKSPLSLSSFLLCPLITVSELTLGCIHGLLLGQLSRPPRSPIDSHLFDCSIIAINVNNIIYHECPRRPGLLCGARAGQRASTL